MPLLLAVHVPRSALAEITIKKAVVPVSSCIFWESNKAPPARPDYSPLGIRFKFSDGHPRPFHITILPRTPGESFLTVQCSLSVLKSTVFFLYHEGTCCRDMY